MKISGRSMRSWRDSCAQLLFPSMMTRSAWPSIFWQRLFSGAEIPVASVAVENEDVAVFAEDLDRLAGVGALVEQVAAWLRIVGN